MMDVVFNTDLKNFMCHFCFFVPRYVRNNVLEFLHIDSVVDFILKRLFLAVISSCY